MRFSKEAREHYATLFRDTSLQGRVPLFIYISSNYIGIDPDRSLVQVSSSEKKEMARFLSPPRVFLVTAISNLARSCTLVKKSETDQESSFALDQLCFVPSKEEIELLQSFTN